MTVLYLMLILRRSHGWILRDANAEPAPTISATLSVIASELSSERSEELAMRGNLPPLSYDLYETSE
ncbi:MAG: hypothetical protein M1347_03990 [Chloroflexi bacterium]|nr:hypothetical protein [Chloroflexota bacterium]